MKKVVWVLVIVIIPSLVFAGGITGGTSKNTTRSQQERLDNSQYEKKSYSVPGWFSKDADRILQFHPVYEGSKKFLEWGNKAGEEQRRNGGVPLTGDTTRENFNRENRNE